MIMVAEDHPYVTNWRRERGELTNLSRSFLKHTTSRHSVRHVGPDSGYRKAERSRHVTA